MSKQLVITPNDPILETLQFKAYRNTVERRAVPFLPAPNEPQTRDIDTPWGVQITAKPGDFLVSEVDNPKDYWPIDPVVFEESYVITRPGYCIKKAVTHLVPLTDVTGGDEDQRVTIETMEGPETVRAGDFYLAKGVKGELWPYPKDKIEEVMVPVE
jgi:hypothetical protein